MLLCLLFVWGFSVTEAAVNPKSVAVYTEGTLDPDEKMIVTSSVLARLSGDKEYRAFERNTSFINALNNEQDYQTSGEVPECEIRTIGHRMGVDYVIVVHVSIVDDLYLMSARLINMETAEIIKSVKLTRQYTDSSILSSMANNIAYRLINKKSK